MTQREQKRPGTFVCDTLHFYLLVTRRNVKGILKRSGKSARVYSNLILVNPEPSKVKSEPPEYTHLQFLVIEVFNCQRI